MEDGILEKIKKAFFYGDIGYNFPMKNKPGKEVYYYNTYDFSGGIYTDFGIGFQLSLNKYSSLIFSLGHSYKKLQNKIGIKTCNVPLVRARLITVNMITNLEE